MIAQPVFKAKYASRQFVVESLDPLSGPSRTKLPSTTSSSSDNTCTDSPSLELTLSIKHWILRKYKPPNVLYKTILTVMNSTKRVQIMLTQHIFWPSTLLTRSLLRRRSGIDYIEYPVGEGTGSWRRWTCLFITCASDKQAVPVESFNKWVLK